MLNKNYLNLIERLEEISHLNGVMSTIGWDQEVMMPPGAAEARAKQISALAGIIHERMTDPGMGDCLAALKNESIDNFNAFERCNIDEACRSYELEVKIPKRLVQELAELGSRGQPVWAKARQENKFSDFAPTIKRFLALKKEWASYAFPEQSAYDANISLFERGTTMSDITPVFEQLKVDLIPFIQRIRESQFQPDTSFLSGQFPIEKQEALARRICEEIGFRFDQGRMDVSIHPFCGGSHPTDVRITTRYKENNFIESLYAVIHETGHALYEQGRTLAWGDLPVSESLTMGIHESQSLFWERMIAQSEGFCRHYFSTIHDLFPDRLNGVAVDSFYRAVNTCKPDFVRVEADELTYPLHVILRYEIEKGLFDDSMRVEDLPEIWNELMMKYFGIKPPTDTLGVLQDSHWSGGAFGYFPSYALGALYACQFYRAMIHDLPDTADYVASGNFGPIKDWLNKQIHSQGKLYTPQQLVQRVTGESLNPVYFTDYLMAKYSTICRLN